MERNRKNEIALAFLKQLLKEQGFEVGEDFRIRVGGLAKKAGVPFAEAIEFAAELGKELVDEVSDVKAPPTPVEDAQFDHCSWHGHGGH